MPIVDVVILGAGFILWLTPFLLVKRTGAKAQKLDRRARWGILLEVIAYSILWQFRFWGSPPAPWRVALSVLFFALAALLSFSGTRALGRQWRIDAGLNADHELVRSGPYRVVRHPIYASMLCLLLGIGMMVSRWPLFLAALVLFIAGTEIRVRVEDSLLSSAFGDQFLAYRKSVSAYIPFVR